MATRILDEHDVRKLLPMRDCMDVMERVLVTTSRGNTVNPLRTGIRLPGGSGLLGLMPAYLGDPPGTGIKVVTVTPGNHGTRFDAHQGAVLLFEVEHGRLTAVIDASSVTAIRTAAVSGVATRCLAGKDASSLAILGSGVQAATHLEAMLASRELERIRIWSPTRTRAEAFARRETGRHGIDLEVVDTPRDAVAGADLVCTTTAAREPVLEGAWLDPGTHINAVGACVRSHRELDTEAVARSRLFVDRRESALNESGDILVPLSEGAFGEEHILAELGEVLDGKHPGRESPGEITLFESLGIGVEDLGAAEYLHRRALETDTGISVDLGGVRDEG